MQRESCLATQGKKCISGFNWWNLTFSLQETKTHHKKKKGYWLIKSYFFSQKDSVQGRTFYTYVMDNKCKKSMHPQFWCHKVFSVIHKLPDCSISWIEETLKDLSDSLICASEKLQVSSFDLLTYEWLHSSVCNRHHRGHMITLNIFR